MAQSPENKAPSSSSENAQQSENERQLHGAIGQAREAGRNMASATDTTARHGGEATQRATREIGETVRRGAAAGSQAAQANARAAADAARRGVDTLAEGQRQILEGIAERYESVGQRMVQSLQENVSGLRTLLAPPAEAAESLRDLQESITGLMNGVLQSNIRATQEVLRMTDPAALFDVQRRFVRDYLDTLMQGTSAFIRISRQTTEQALRPIEERIGQRRQHASRGGHQQHNVVSDVMSPNVRLVTPEDTVQQASRLMRDEDTGVLPVGEGDRLVGIVTDRDVTLRLVAEGKDPTRTKVREVMSEEPKYVFEDEDVGHVAENMAQQQIRRLPVVNRNKRLVGIVSIGDLARAGRAGEYAGRAMRGVARESGSQVSSAAAE